HQLRFPGVGRTKGEKWTEHRARLERLYTAGRYTGLQYKVISQPLNATDFGVAQRRHRVFIVGIQADLGIEYSFPLGTHTQEALLREQWVTEEYWERHGIPKRRRPHMPKTVAGLLPTLNCEANAESWRTVRDTISDLPTVGLGRTSHTVLNH